MIVRTLAPETVKPALTAIDEIAFVDVREYGQYGEGHPFFSVNLPYSRLELRAAYLLPRRDCSIILFDENDGVAQKAATRLSELGYTNLAIMEGGALAWAAAGFTLFKGVNVPSKAFGEAVEQTCKTPRITAQELNARLDRKDKLVLLDGRTLAEFRKMNVPGARACPNGELGLRIGDFTPDDTTLIVINCAGRTRSIIGAQTLAHLGVANPILALENGTQGWELAGYDLQVGADPGELPEVERGAINQHRQRAETLRTRFAVPAITLETLKTWQVDKTRSLYLLDVRTHGEYEAGYFPGSLHAPGGQLVQTTDHWIAVRGARIVLLDDSGIRASTTAMWLRQMGHDAVVLDRNVAELAALESGPDAGPPCPETLPLCPAADLAGKISNGAALLDLGPSQTYRKEHIEGANWAVRPRLADLDLQPGQDIILLSAERAAAELAALDLRELGIHSLSLNQDGADAWRAAGLSITATPDRPADDLCIDHLYFVHERHIGNLEAARQYLAWEINLLNQMDDQESSVYTIIN